jgi:hypothetical protein
MWEVFAAAAAWEHAGHASAADADALRQTWPRARAARARQSGMGDEEEERLHAVSLCFMIVWLPATPFCCVFVACSKQHGSTTICGRACEFCVVETCVHDKCASKAKRDVVCGATTTFGQGFICTLLSRWP